jgi:hypothetical protein
MNKKKKKQPRKGKRFSEFNIIINFSFHFHTQVSFFYIILSNFALMKINLIKDIHLCKSKRGSTRDPLGKRYV